MRPHISATPTTSTDLTLSDSAPIIVDKARIAPAHTEPVSRVGDDRWDLTPLLHKPTVAGARSINFDTFPPAFRSVAKRLVWLCVNVPTPVEDLERPTATRSQLSVGSIVAYAGFMRLWMAWLDAHGIHRFDGVTDDVYRCYCSEVAASGLGRESQANRLFAITRCWLYGPYLPDTDTLIRPYWEDTLARVDVLGDAQWSAENRTPPIHPQTMSALLVWAIRFCTDFSADIIAAVRTKSNPPRLSHLDGLIPSERFGNYAQQQGTSSKTIPGFYPANRPDQRCIAKQFIGWQLGLGTDDVVHLGSMDRVFGDLDPIDEAVLPVPITGTIDTRPWTGGINFYDVDNLSRLLATAAFIVVAYLTGMRGEECRALRQGCCRTITDEKTGQNRHLIYGHVFKGALDESGNTLPAGSERDQPWRAIAPVAKAVEVMEALCPDSDLLFPVRAYTPFQRADGDKAVHPRMIRDRTADLITWCNAKAEEFGRTHESIPADPDGPIVVKRFRRTLAWFIYRKPGGRVALGIQYGHLRGHSTDGYGSRVASGLRDVFSMEEALAAAEYLEAAYTHLDDGESVTGPAAQRYRDGVRLYHRQFGGRYLTSRQAAALTSNPRLRIYDNSVQFVTCCYDQSKALCHPDRDKAAGVEASPDITNCQPHCRNIARTGRNIADAEAAIQHAREEIASPAIPLPLKARLEQRVGSLHRIIDHHHNSEGRR